MKTQEASPLTVLAAFEAGDVATAINTVPSLSLDALKKLKDSFSPERWAKIERQAAQRAEDLQELCTRLLVISLVRYPDNDLAALYLAGNRLLITLGSAPNPADVKRLETALNPTATAQAIVNDPQAVEAGITLTKRGGKAQAVPPSVK